MDQTKLWDHFQNDNEIGDVFAGARSRYQFLARHIAPEMAVLNIGVGRGGLESILLNKGAVVSALDPSEKSIAKLRELFALGDRAQVGFSQAMPFKNDEFDVVIMSEVLEHLSDEVLVETLNEVSRVLKSGGRFIGTVPADEILLFNYALCPHCGKSFHRWGHIQSFSNSQLTKMLESRFYNVALSRHFFGNTRSLNWKGLIVLFVKKIMLSLGIQGSGETYFFSTQKN
jgi:SAM-dependent methyltransferase